MEKQKHVLEAVRSVIESIPEGCTFDSHYVIDGLMANEEFTDAYLRFASEYAMGDRPTLTTHQRIGHAIKNSCATLAERLPQDSWSMTIHGRGGKCALWRRI